MYVNDNVMPAQQFLCWLRVHSQIDTPDKITLFKFMNE